MGGAEQARGADTAAHPLFAALACGAHEPTLRLRHACRAEHARDWAAARPSVATALVPGHLRVARDRVEGGRRSQGASRAAHGHTRPCLRGRRVTRCLHRPVEAEGDADGCKRSLDVVRRVLTRREVSQSSLYRTACTESIFLSK